MDQQVNQPSSTQLNSSMHTSKVPRTEKRGISKPSLVGVLVAVVLSSALTIFFARIRANALPNMSRADFDAARQRWSEAGISSYEITVKVQGMQPGEYTAVVENDIATAANFDGRPLTRQRTFGTWAVTGMFDTLSRDLETNERDKNLMLKAVFDPEFGFPTKYARIELKTGSHDALQWEVTRFVKR